MLKQIRLTKKQKTLVDTIVAFGCSVTEAASKSGYAEGESGRVTASKTEYWTKCYDCLKEST